MHRDDMVFIESEKNGRTGRARLGRGKVNALNGAVIDELRAVLRAWEGDSEVGAVILTGTGKFFSFGFDIPEFLSFSRAQFTDYLRNFTGLYTDLFQYPKPVVAALNGHAIAGGCMLALACDHRIMVTGKAKIALNEISFGSSVFAGSTEMLRFWVGSANATAVLVSGAMYSAEEARSLGLVQEVASEADLAERANGVAATLAAKAPAAFASVKSLLRQGVVEEMKRREADAIRAFVEIWYSDATWANLRNIQIR